MDIFYFFIMNLIKYGEDLKALIIRMFQVICFFH
jgi:hypothetical protein